MKLNSKRNMLSRTFSLCFLCLPAFVGLSGCAGAEQGTGQALGNIGSIFESESKKVWIPANENSLANSDLDKTAADSEEEKEIQAKNWQGPRAY